MNTIELGTQPPILEQFIQTDSFRMLYAQALGYAAIPMSGDLRQELRSDFVGALFEELAYDTLRQTPGGRRILSPTDTFLHSYQRAVEDTSRRQYHVQFHPFGRRNLDKVYTPDGLLTLPDGTNTIFEYTSTSEPRVPDYFAKKARECTTFCDFNADKSKLVFVVTQNCEIPESVLQLPHVATPIQLPFDSLQLRAFVDHIFHSYRPDEHAATLVEIGQEMQDQYKRARTALSSLKNRRVPPGFDYSELSPEIIARANGLTSEMVAQLERSFTHMQNGTQFVE